jgi:hypothetical protein
LHFAYLTVTAFQLASYRFSSMVAACGFRRQESSLRPVVRWLGVPLTHIQVTFYLE